MYVFLTFVLAVLASFGFLSVVKLLFDAASYHARPEDMFLVVHLYGEEAEVEQTVRSCLRDQDDRSSCGKIIFIDKGMTPDAQAATELLLRRREDALLCGERELPQILNWERETLGAGTD